MAIYSFTQKGIDLEAIEIDISLVPGLPSFQIIGLPDASIKESISRIKSALRIQGFKLPQREQVLVNLKPAFERKSSRGLDLPIAVAYLVASGQIEKSAFYQNSATEVRPFFYGELSLNGDVVMPSDLDLLEDLPNGGQLITGVGSLNLNYKYGEIRELKDLVKITWREPIRQMTPTQEDTPSFFESFSLGLPLARLLMVAATGEHNVFVAGPAGSGKTTFGEILYKLLRPPTLSEKRKIDKIAAVCGRPESGRPLVRPHHTASDIALLGGGLPPQPGEITRAQNGILFLDEFLEFKTNVKESLREPIEKHEMTVVRSGNKVTFPADFILVATSNLCPCGDFVPNVSPQCGFYSSHCKSYYKKLSGPLLDRFEIVSFSHEWKSKRTKSFTEVKGEVVRAQNFARSERGQSKMNSRLSIGECESTLAPFVRSHLMPECPSSHRRYLSLLRVARTFADLEGSKQIMGPHLNWSKALTIQPFRDIKAAWN